MTPAGIEPATFRFVAQRLSHCATAVPISPRSFHILKGKCRYDTIKLTPQEYASYPTASCCECTTQIQYIQYTITVDTLQLTEKWVTEYEVTITIRHSHSCRGKDGQQYVNMMSSFFWDVAERRLVACYRQFGTSYSVQISWTFGRCAKIPAERWLQLHGRDSLKYRKLLTRSLKTLYPRLSVRSCPRHYGPTSF